MTLQRRTSFLAGLFYLLTFVSIPTLSLYAAVHVKEYVVGQGPDTPALVGGVLELVVAMANVATGVILYRVLKKQDDMLAMGYLSARIAEGTLMFAGVAVLLTVVGLRQAGVGPEVIPVGQALAALYDRIFFVSQGFIPAVNDILLGVLFYQSRLLPRWFALLGVIGGLVLIVGDAATMAGTLTLRGADAALFAIPVALFEFILGIWLVVKGFNPAREQELWQRP